MRVETQQSIFDWHEKEFGPLISNMYQAQRTETELKELFKDLQQEDENQHAIEEAADVAINLYRLVGNMGGDLDAAIDKKMAINRLRKWKPDGLGCGRHVKETE